MATSVTDGPWTVPASWRTASPYRFEGLVERWLPPGEQVPHTLSEEGLADLEAGLEEGGQIAVRAVVLLARSRDGRAAEVLLNRLEARVPAPGRADDAADVVAAGALARWPSAQAGAAGRGIGARLARLAVGDALHPDLEVRVECARSALGRGRVEVLPFLLRVLRAGTPTEHLDAPDWERVLTLTWARTRAAEALAIHLGVRQELRPDGSFAHIEEQVRRYETLLGVETPGTAGRD
jgi:hypothetical protein